MTDWIAMEFLIGVTLFVVAYKGITGRWPWRNG